MVVQIQYDTRSIKIEWLALIVFGKTVFHHLTIHESKCDPFSFQLMSSIVKLIQKRVSICLIKLSFDYFITHLFVFILTIKTGKYL